MTTETFLVTLDVVEKTHDGLRRHPVEVGVDAPYDKRASVGDVVAKLYERDHADARVLRTRTELPN